MFNPEFYPTNNRTAVEMTTGLDIQNKTILEPQGGKGDLVDFLYEMGAKKVLTSEINDELRMILSNKCQVIGSDFLQITKDQVSHIDAIVMNPPFSNAEEHILHAFEIAPEGCEIRALCNWKTIENPWTRQKRKLQSVIKNAGLEPKLLEGYFSDAERKTDVDVGLVTLMKPVISEDRDWSGFFTEEEDEISQGSGIMAFNEVRALVQRYIGTIQAYDEVVKAAEVMNSYTSPIGVKDVVKFHMTYGDNIATKEDFMKELQKRSWKYILDKMNLKKFVTSKVMEDVNKFVEEQQKYPFTMRNIYKMIEIIIGTRENTMNRSLVEVFDKLTQHHHENRYNVEGWKTNSHYLVNKKFIIDWVTEGRDGGGICVKYDTACTRQLDDLQKALSYLMGTNEEVQSVYDWGYNRAGSSHNGGEPRKSNTWYDWGHLTVKGFFKGTMHCKFKDEKTWEMFNRKVAEIKGFPLPEAI